MESLLKQVDLKFENLSVQATRVTLKLEMPSSSITSFLERVPDSVLQLLRPIIPTLIYKIELKE